MSNHKGKTENSDSFTLDHAQSHDSSDIPSIDELLGAKKTKQAKSSTTSSIAEKTSFISNIKSLKDFGTKLEIHFLLKDGSHSFFQYNDHTTRGFFGLDELYQEMKIPQKFTQECGAFREFKKTEHQFLFDAFGINEQQFLQFVPNQANQIITVYASEKSMAEQKDKVIAYTEQKNKNISASSLDVEAA